MCATFGYRDRVIVIDWEEDVRNIGEIWKGILGVNQSCNPKCAEAVLPGLSLP
jgi:hypothetical protein